MSPVPGRGGETSGGEDPGSGQDRGATDPGSTTWGPTWVPEAARLYRLPIVALDFETTGLAAHRGDAVCEVGLVAATGERTEVLLSELVNPGRALSSKARALTGIQDEDLVGAQAMVDIVPRILELIGSAPLVMHNAPFDLHFLFKAVSDAGRPPVENLAIDTLLMARFLDRSREGNSLRQLAENYGLNRGHAHRAADDARATALAYHALVPYLELRGYRTVGDLVRGRMAGAATVFVERPSSMLIDLVTRAAAAGIVVHILYAARPGMSPFERKVRPKRLEADRYMVGWDLDVEEERTYRLDRILSLTDGESNYMSPWILPEELPGRFRR